MSESSKPNPTPARWRDVWQVPALAGSALILGGGITWAVMTAPKPDLSIVFQDAKKQVEEAQYSPALETLNTKILPFMTGTALTPDQRREFYLLRARALAMGQRDLGIDREENNRNIVTEYKEAEHMEAVLDGRDWSLLAHSLISLGKLDEAAEALEKIPEDEPERRFEVLSRLVDAGLALPQPNYGAALDLLALATAEELPVEHRLWVLSKEAEILTRQGYADAAITKLVRTLPRLESTVGQEDGATPEQLGPLYLTLAKAYIAVEEFPQASAQLKRSTELLGEENPLLADVTYLRGQIDQRNGEYETARENYIELIERFSFSNDRLRAILGLAEVEAALANQSSNSESAEAAIDRYAELVEAIHASDENAKYAPGTEEISTSLMARFDDHFDRADFDGAFRFANLLEKLWGVDKAPADVVMALARVRIQLAGHTLREAGAGSLLELAAADPATQRAAKEHFARAGDYFRLHAAKVVQADSAGYGDSLWAAADSFDRAGDLEASVAAFQQFATDFPSDPRRAEALFRLAEAHRARGDYELAINLYRELVSGGGPEFGQYGDKSYVPLAQTLLDDDKPDNDEEGERLLLEVVRGKLGGTSTPAYRSGLRELGVHYYKKQEYERAIEKLGEFLQRFDADAQATKVAAGDVVAHGTAELKPDASELIDALDGPSGESHGAADEEKAASAFGQHRAVLSAAEGIESVRYRLADSYRRSSESLVNELATAIPDAERREKENARDDRLRKASGVFERVRQDLEAVAHRTALEDVYLRNSYFYLADCAYGLKDYETAIRLYDAARERYSKDPASLVAMTQIVNAYVAMGDTRKAAVANERAVRFYKSIPATAWDDPNLPMTRSDWENWLASQAKINAERRLTEGGDAAEREGG